MTDESRRSTAAQFFMDEETKHNESVSTYDKVNRRPTKFYPIFLKEIFLIVETSLKYVDFLGKNDLILSCTAFLIYWKCSFTQC